MKARRDLEDDHEVRHDQASPEPIRSERSVSRAATAGATKAHRDAPPIDFPCVIIRVSRLYRAGMDVDALYDITQGWWRVGPQREKAQYAVAVAGGIVRAVFTVDAWRPRIKGDRDWEHDRPGKPRWGFEGKPADECAYLLGSDVRHLFKPGNANPILYQNLDSTPTSAPSTAAQVLVAVPDECPIHFLERDSHGVCPECARESSRVPFPDLLDHHGTDVFSILAQPFAESILAKATLLSMSLVNRRQRSAIRSAISEDLKKCCDVIFPDVRQPHVSRRAAAEAERLGLELRTKAWAQQPGFDRGRQVFHHEHVVPVVALREACLAATNTSDVVRILHTQMRLAWILKTEDAKLTRLGYAYIRPDPEGAYAEAGIELVL